MVTPNKEPAVPTTNKRAINTINEVIKPAIGPYKMVDNVMPMGRQSIKLFSPITYANFIPTMVIKPKKIP